MSLPVTLSYKFEQEERLLHVTADGPSSVEVFERVMPQLLQDISGTRDILLLVEIRNFAPDGYQRHDLGFYVINLIKGDTAKCAFVCPEDLRPIADDLAQLTQHSGSPTAVFAGVSSARKWLLA